LNGGILKNPLEIIATRIHPRISEKKEIWSLISDSYVGGLKYIKGKHLFKYPKEGDSEHSDRSKRSVFFNHIQPICDTLAGFIFSNEPAREIPTEINYILEKASKQKDFNSYMQTVAIHSIQYTCGTLVESPAEASQYKTKADRMNAGINPYLTLYFPWQIRDFSVDDSGELNWVILDNCHWVNSDPTVESVEKKSWGLWERNSYKEIIETKSTEGKKTYAVEKFVEHNLGKVPFVFHNFRDLNDDIIAESPVEDMAILDRAIYNFLSCLDEMIHSGTFKMLFVPIMKEGDLPADLIKSGVGNMSVFTYNGAVSGAPKFDGAGLENVEPFIKAIDMYLKEIFSKVGLDKDQDKAYVQSGVAKLIEFQRCEAFLRIGAKQLEQSEKYIFEILCLWEQKSSPKIDVDYQTNFNQEEVGNVLTRLYEAMALPIKAVSDMAMKEIAKKTFSYLPEDDMKEFIKSVENELEAKKKIVVTQDQIDAEKAARTTTAAMPINNGDIPIGQQK